MSQRQRLSQRQRQQSVRPRWTPFERAQQITRADTGEIEQVYVNSLYTVIIAHNADETMAKLSIRRNDRDAIHDWRDLQRIKNELVGPECEGLELFPAESRLVDTANHYWLWVFLDPTFRIGVGFQERLIADYSHSPTGARQRPFRDDERPADAMSGDEIEMRVDQYNASARRSQESDL